jgi:hypothetical protein
MPQQAAAPVKQWPPYPAGAEILASAPLAASECARRLRAPEYALSRARIPRIARIIERTTAMDNGKERLNPGAIGNEQRFVRGSACLPPAAATYNDR